MAIVYLDCDNGYEDADHVCNPCVDPELGNVRSVALIKPGVVLSVPFIESEWTAQVLAGNIKIIPSTRGTFDGGTAKMGTGYGDVKERKLGSEYMLSFKDPDFKDNSGKGQFYDNAEKQDWNVAFRTETMLHYVDSKCTLVEKAPITEDLESEIVSEVELKWISSNKPQISAYAPLADLFKCFEVDVIHVSAITLPATANVNITAVYYDLGTQLTFTPANANNTLIAWTTSNAEIATVDAAGVVHVLATGTVTITATSNDGGFTDSTVITVDV